MCGSKKKKPHRAAWCFWAWCSALYIILFFFCRLAADDPISLHNRQAKRRSRHPLCAYRAGGAARARSCRLLLPRRHRPALLAVAAVVSGIPAGGTTLAPRSTRKRKAAAVNSEYVWKSQAKAESVQQTGGNCCVSIPVPYGDEKV